MPFVINELMLADAALQYRSEKRQCLVTIWAAPLEEVNQIEPNNQYDGCIAGIQTRLAVHAIYLPQHNAEHCQRNGSVQAIKADAAPSVVLFVLRKFYLIFSHGSKTHFPLIFLSF